MDILPIEKIRDEDGALVGTDLVNLARLAQLGFPVAPGIVITPIEIELRTVLKYFNLNDKEIFEQSLTLVRREILKIVVPENLAKILSKKKIRAQSIWQSLLEAWLSEVRTKVWQGGFKDGVTLGLSAQSIFFTQKIAISGNAFFDPVSDQVEVRLETGDLTPKIREQIDSLTTKANKRLFLPQIYHWIVEEKSEKVQLVKLSPFTQSPLREAANISYPSPEEKREPKSVTKVFLDLSEGLVVNPAVDGVLICGEKSENFKNLVFKLVEAGNTFSQQDVIFKFSDAVEHIGGVRGSLRLIHQKSLLQTEAQAFLFARNTKRLLSLSIAVPFVRSVNEFLEIKREISSLGITRKGSLKIWLEVAVPENIIHLEEYLSTGLDGILLNLDELSSWLGGFDDNLPESVFYQKGVKALLKFLEDAMKTLHKNRIPVLAMGNLSLHDDVLEFLISKGVYGVVSSLANSHSLHEHLKFLEKRHVRDKLG